MKKCRIYSEMAAHKRDILSVVSSVMLCLKSYALCFGNIVGILLAGYLSFLSDYYDFLS